MTRLACFFNDLDPRTEASLIRFAPAAGLTVEWADTSATLQTYADEMRKRWNGAEDLIIVEQDKELHATCLPTLLSCPEHWCGYTSWLFPVPHTTLGIGSFGVTRFSAEVQRLVPVEAFEGEVQFGIDRRFGDYLREQHGIGCHLHGHVVHHHVYDPRPLRIRQHVEALRAAGLVPPAVYPEPLAPHLLPGSYDLSG